MGIGDFFSELYEYAKEEGRKQRLEEKRKEEIKRYYDSTTEKDRRQDRYIKWKEGENAKYRDMIRHEREKDREERKLAREERQKNKDNSLYKKIYFLEKKLNI